MFEEDEEDTRPTPPAAARLDAPVTLFWCAKNMANPELLLGELPRRGDIIGGGICICIVEPVFTALGTASGAQSARGDEASWLVKPCLLLTREFDDEDEGGFGLSPSRGKPALDPERLEGVGVVPPCAATVETPAAAAAPIAIADMVKVPVLR